MAHHCHSEKKIKEKTCMAHRFQLAKKKKKMRMAHCCHSKKKIKKVHGPSLPQTRMPFGVSTEVKGEHGCQRGQNWEKLKPK